MWYWLARLALWMPAKPWVELAVCLLALPQLQPSLGHWMSPLLAQRDRRLQRVAAKCVVRIIKAISVVLVGQPAIVHSADVLPHIDRAAELTWQVARHSAMTALLLYIRRYSQRSYYTVYKYFYYYQTEQLSWKQRPTAASARRQLLLILNEQRWAEFASAKTFGLAMVLFHQGEPEIPEWIAQLNFALARLLAVVTLSQALSSWQRELAPCGLLFALVLVQRRELAQYWRIVGAVGVGTALGVAGLPLWLCAAIVTIRPFWFGRSIIKFSLKRLSFAMSCAAPAFWLFSASIQPRRVWWQLLAYSLCLGWHCTAGVLAMLVFGQCSDHAPEHLLSMALVASLVYILVAYSCRPEQIAKPKVNILEQYQLIENYRATI